MFLQNLLKAPPLNPLPGWRGEERLSVTDTEWRSQEGVCHTMLSQDFTRANV